MRPTMKQHLSYVAAVGMCFLALITVAYAQVRADSGSIAIGGSVTASTVIVGIPQEKVDELVRDAKRPLEELTVQQRENIALLKEKLDLNERQVRAALGILGENDISPERLAAKLVEIAERFKDLQATASAQPGDDPKITALKTDAQKAIETGELAKADALLADVETEQRRALDRLAISAAETSARRGEIALARLRYAEAATHFATAAAMFPPSSPHEDKRISYLTNEANALYQQGEELGDNSALLLAIERRSRLAELITFERAPLEWSKVQNGLGGALFTLGEREGGTARLEEAITIHRKVLTQAIRESVPLEWAMAQSGVANALQVIGMREGGTAKLEQAVAAYQEALKERTRERAPLQWAATQNNLGSALASLGERQSGTAKLEQAVAAFREALKEYTRERTPLDWAMTQNNLGTVLLGLRRTDEAIVAFREALKERTRERVPLQWAATQSNLGMSLGALGGRESGTAKLEEAVAAYREALKEYTRERAAPEWATTQNNLGVELRRLGERESGTAKLEEAVAAFREALKERTRERMPIEWAQSSGNEGVALILLAERRADVTMAEAALNQINIAFEVTRERGVPSAMYYEMQLLMARTVVARLRGLR
jgi:tetratricopeptide (TPR) repeat protein